MDKAELATEINGCLQQICYASDCFAVYMDYISAIEEYNEVMNISRGFFSITQHSISHDMLMALARVFVGSDNRDVTIRSLIKTCRANIALFNSEISSMGQASDIVELLSKGDSILVEESMREILKKLKGRRDKCFAHNDIEYFNDTKRMQADFPLEPEEVENLIGFSYIFCDHLLSYLNVENQHPLASNCVDLKNLLRRVKM